MVTFSCYLWVCGKCVWSDNCSMQKLIWGSNATQFSILKKSFKKFPSSSDSSVKEITFKRIGYAGYSRQTKSYLYACVVHYLANRKRNKKDFEITSSPDMLAHTGLWWSCHKAGDHKTLCNVAVWVFDWVCILWMLRIRFASFFFTLPNRFKLVAFSKEPLHTRRCRCNF